MNANVKVADVQRHLVWLWGGGFLTALLVMFVLTVAGTFSSSVQEAWAWFLPTLLPTVSVALSAAVLQGQQSDRRVVPRFLSQLAKAVSAAYVAVVLATLLIWPLSGM